jgi:hypothetical protein
LRLQSTRTSTPSLLATEPAHLASAEAIRWLEWGSNSYQDFAFGLAMLLFGVVIVWTARVPRPIGVLMGLAGLAWLMVGWVVGSLGFGPHAAPMQAGEACLLAWVIWLFIVAWRWKAPVPATLGRPTAASS